MNLKNQKQLASSILNVGVNRVWIDPEGAEEVEMAITRSEIRKLINEGAIKALPERSQSRARSRSLTAKKRIGRRRGSGSRKGGKYSLVSRKTRWINRIRSIRRRLRILKERRIITASNYRRLYMKAKGGEFRNVSELERFITEQGLRRRSFG